MSAGFGERKNNFDFGIRMFDFGFETPVVIVGNEEIATHVNQKRDVCGENAAGSIPYDSTLYF